MSSQPKSAKCGHADKKGGGEGGARGAVSSKQMFNINFTAGKK